ncbi:MAG: thiamine-phosphate kinase [Legionellaceae bacterium]|nr:thiamine-phosphate kinase [Legionellaceae bacterium]
MTNSLNEHSIIHTLQQAFPDYIGDDAAVIDFSDEQSYVVAKDLLVEDIHFRLRYSEPKHLAHKLLHVNLSDIAAMGAKTQFVLLGISLPLSYEPFVQEFLQHFTEICKSLSIVLIGGDTTGSPDSLFLSATAIGIAENTHLKYRHTAKPGDILCVIGALGYAHLGFMALETSTPNLDIFKKSFLMPQARIKEGLWCGAQAHIQAMMDISDGLFIDLQRLCEASGVAAEIHLEQLKTHKTYREACQQLALDPLITQLTGGEDYGLLLSIDKNHYDLIADQFKNTFAYPLQAIGRITEGQGLSFTQNGEPQPLTLTPFSHFNEL